MKGFLKWLALLIVVATIISGCGGNAATANSDNNQLDNGPAGSQQCMLQLTPEQKQQYINNATQNGGNVDTISPNGDGTTDVCIVQPDGSQKIINKDDGDNDWLMYAALLMRSNTLLAVGALTGDIDPMDALVMSVLMGVTSDGRYYQPYTRYGSSNTWDRVPNYEVYHSGRPVTNVTYVYVGSGATQRTMSYNQYRTNPPTGYAVKTVKPADLSKTQQYQAGKKSSVINGRTVTQQRNVAPGRQQTTKQRANTGTKQQNSGGFKAKPKTGRK